MPNKLSNCAICGEFEEDHHDFVSVVIPDGCVCTDGTNYGDWYHSSVCDICSSYTTDSGSRDADVCDICGHALACHRDQVVIDKRQLKLF